MKVLIVGSGGREHALAWKIKQSPLLTKLYAAPGNAGISDIAECVAVQADDVSGLVEFAEKERMDLTVIGPEAPLVQGVTDTFRSRGLKVFGPSQKAARVEGSKAFAKDLMHSFKIPTAHYEIFDNINEAKHYVIETEMPIVIKADGLAAGKGVIICDSSQEAVEALTQMMEDHQFGPAGDKVIIEQKLSGEELSVIALTDGEKIIPLASSQDHKRVYDNDRGPNTGGMGAYSPCPYVSDEQLNQMVNKTIRPLIAGMAGQGIPYQGVIYAGLMLTKEGPFVLEYNCRFGDPEVQAVLPRLKSDLLPVLAEIAGGRLATERLEWHEKSCLTVVMAAGGYPKGYEKGKRISGIDAVSAQRDMAVFHAGTAKDESGHFITSGGRVLAVSALGDTLRAAFDRAYEGVGKIHFDGNHFRRDIGRRAIEVLQ